MMSNRFSSPKKTSRGGKVFVNNVEKNDSSNDNKLSKLEEFPNFSSTMSSLNDAQVHTLNETDNFSSPGFKNIDIDTDINIDREKSTMSSPYSAPLSPTSMLKLYPGYSGYYKGKVIPVVGRSEFPVSIPCPVDEAPSPTMALTKRPRTALVPLTYDPKNHVKLIIQDIRTKVNERFRTFAEKRLHVKHIFQLYDHEQRGYVSVNDLRICLNRISVSLNSRDMQPLVEQYAGSSPGEFLYAKFLEDVCGPGLFDQRRE